MNIRGFLNKNRADVWCIGYMHHKLAYWFFKSPDWKPIFFGPSSIIFARSGIQLPQNAPRSGRGLDDIKNLFQAQQILRFTIELKEWDLAGRVLAGMKNRFRLKKQRKITESWEDLQNGMSAYFQRDFHKAAKHVEAARNKKIVWNNKALTRSYLQMAVEYWGKKDLLSTRQAALSW